MSVCVCVYVCGGCPEKLHTKHDTSVQVARTRESTKPPGEREPGWMITYEMVLCVVGVLCVAESRVYSFHGDQAQHVNYPRTSRTLRYLLSYSKRFLFVVWGRQCGAQCAFGRTLEFVAAIRRAATAVAALVLTHQLRTEQQSRAKTLMVCPYTSCVPIGTPA